MPTTLSFEKITLPGAYFGPASPLPDIGDSDVTGDIHSHTLLDDTVPEEERPYFNYGNPDSNLPYCPQDQYDRTKTARDFEVVVMENAYLRAEFMPQFGGRLRRLYDKEHNRELVQCNPVFQPANLALRNAWLSGGIEWNIGVIGHSPLTMSPLHTAFLKLSDGTPVLRMYEMERISRASYQLDFYLPEESRFLFVRAHICNTQDKEIPMYWWSNTAVTETVDTRVLVPAKRAYVSAYTGGVTVTSIPMRDGIDRSYSLNTNRAMDQFFDIPDENRKWEAALDGKGEGLIQTSTDRLRGRKLFIWGNRPAGTRWQNFLSQPGEAYIEIQAGLAKTQMQMLPMPANAKWEWLEAYGYLQADPAKVHGDDWDEASGCVGDALEAALPRAFMDAELERLAKELDQKPEPLRFGSGWAALELLRRGNDTTFENECSVYGADTLGAEQLPWLQLLKEGTFPRCRPEEISTGYMGQPEWIPLLEEAIRDGRSDHWHAWLHLGVLYCANSDWAKAEEAFRTSIQRTDNGWAHRNLAMVLMRLARKEEASLQLLRAAQLLRLTPILLECGQCLCSLERWADFKLFYESLSVQEKAIPRIQIMLTLATAEEGDLEKALELLNSDIEIQDLREGEVTLTELWGRVHGYILLREDPEAAKLDPQALRAAALEKYPMPARFNFTM